jgi:outer membrane protein assembly factor BamB
MHQLYLIVMFMVFNHRGNDVPDNSLKRAIITLSLATLLSSIRAEDSWPQFRGPTGQGVSDAKGLPVTWSETENVKWKTAIPGEGHSSPVVSGNRIWLTSSPDKGKTRHVLCVDFATGKLTRDIPLFTCVTTEPCHAMNSYATPTPVLEGSRVYVTFGAPGTACLEAETGKTIWERRDLPVKYFDVGPASSPILYRDSFILNCDGQASDQQFVIALDKNTGKTLWRTDRTYLGNKLPPKTHSSCVPLVIRVASRDQLISPGGHGVRSYDPDTGKELWVARYGGWSVVPRPVFANGLLFICSGTVKSTLLCIRPEGASGDITDAPAVVWKTAKNVPTMPSPLLVDDRLYTLTAATLSCLKPATGEVTWSENIPGQHVASPVAADGRIYLFNTSGGGAVVALGDRFNLLATNRLDSGCSASPAIVGTSLLVRTATHLYRIAK